MAAGSEILADADIRLEWAYQHIKTFEREIQAFHADEGNYIAGNVNEQGRRILMYSGVIPAQMNLIASDATHNIRVSLDYLACALAVLNRRSTTKVGFPIADDVQEFSKPEIQGKIKKLSPLAQKFIAGLKPYKGGCDLLWALHEIDKSDKHRKLVLLKEAGPMWYWVTSDHDESWDAVSSTPRRDYKLSFVPGFADVQGFERQSALTLLKQFLGSVGNILSEARRIFFPGTQRRIVFGETLPAG